MKKDINSLFKRAVDGYEEPYSPQAWEAIKNKIPHSGMGSLFSWLVGGIAGVALIVGATFFFSPDTTDTAQKSNISPISEETYAAIIEQKEGSNSLSQKENVQPLPNKLSVETHSENEQKTSPKYQTDKQNEQFPNISPSAVVQDSKPTSGIDNQHNPQNSMPQIKFVVPTISCSAQNICPGDKVIFKAEQLNEKYSIHWLSSTGDKYSGNNIQLALNNSIDLTAVVTDENGTEHKAGQYHVTVNKIEVPHIQLTEDQKNTKPHFVLQVENQNYARVQWNLDYQNALGKTFDFYLVKKGSYTVNYTIEDKNNCVAHFTKEVQLDNDYNLFAENTFTPSASINNTFLPKALLARNVDFKLTIFDRSGKTLYQTTDATLPWKGEVENGDFATQGTYLWTVTLINEEGTPEKYAGEILLLR
jgi:hypothetical protein